MPGTILPSQVYGLRLKPFLQIRYWSLEFFWAGLTCAVFFPIPAPSSLQTRFFLARTPFFSPRTSLHHTHFSSSRTSLYHTFLFSIVHSFSILLNSCLYISGSDRNSNFSLSLWPRAPNAPRLKNRNKRSFYKLQVCEPRYFTMLGSSLFPSYLSPLSPP